MKKSVVAKSFDTLPNVSAAARVTLTAMGADELVQMHHKIKTVLGYNIASLNVAERVRQSRPDHLWTIRSRQNGALRGIYALIMLNQHGEMALERGTFNGLDPASSMIAGPDQDVAAIYHWMVYAPGMAAAAIAQIAKKLQEPSYRYADLYGVGSSLAGIRMMKSVGFQAVKHAKTRNLFRYRRLANVVDEIAFQS